MQKILFIYKDIHAQARQACHDIHQYLIFSLTVISRIEAEVIESNRLIFKIVNKYSFNKYSKSGDYFLKKKNYPLENRKSKNSQEVHKRILLQNFMVAVGIENIIL